MAHGCNLSQTKFQIVVGENDRKCEPVFFGVSVLCCTTRTYSAYRCRRNHGWKYETPFKFGKQWPGYQIFPKTKYASEVCQCEFGGSLIWREDLVHFFVTTVWMYFNATYTRVLETIIPRRARGHFRRSDFSYCERMYVCDCVCKLVSYQYKIDRQAPYTMWDVMKKDDTKH